MPERIQRRRTRGWRMPEGAVYVGRPSKWGNPCAIGDWVMCVRDGQITSGNVDAAGAVDYYRHILGRLLLHNPKALEPLRGKDLVCWCPLDRPCHADVLLERANA